MSRSRSRRGDRYERRSDRRSSERRSDDDRPSRRSSDDTRRSDRYDSRSARSYDDDRPIRRDRRNEERRGKRDERFSSRSDRDVIELERARSRTPPRQEFFLLPSDGPSESSLHSRAADKAFGLLYSDTTSTLLESEGTEPFLPLSEWTCTSCNKSNQRDRTTCWNCRCKWEPKNNRNWECVKCKFSNFCYAIECFKCKKFRRLRYINCLSKYRIVSSKWISVLNNQSVILINEVVIL